MRLQAHLSHAAVRRRVEETPVRVDRWDEAKDRLRSPASALSSGQQQRLCIARALSTG
jgi:phosphate transport system ATP-binding protein